MKRRNFLKLSSAVTAGMGLYGNNTFYRNIFNTQSFASLNANNDDRVLIIVRLNGGNDGLNTVIPLHDFDGYATLRPSIALKNPNHYTGEGSPVKLHNYTSIEDRINVALHPSMGRFKELYDQDKLCLIRAVGYEHPNYSHFISTNIMFNGHDGSGSFDNSGWIGRYLNQVFPDLINGPVGENTDPLAIHLGSINPALLFNHPHGTAEYSARSLEREVSKQSQSRVVSDLSEYEILLKYVEKIRDDMDVYGKRVRQVFNDTNAKNDHSAYSTSSNLTNQLKVVARLIRGGIKTRVFMVSQTRYDTHASQVDKEKTHLGNHSKLLTNLSESIYGFMQDINTTKGGIANIGDRIVLATFSEFGRTPVPNTSFGTDHGNISPMFVIGNKVKGGVIGGTTDLKNVYRRRFPASARQYDYRQIYSTLLQDWMGADDTILNKIDFKFMKLDLIEESATLGAKECAAYPVEEKITTYTDTIDGWLYFTVSGATSPAVAIKFQSGYGPAQTSDIVVTVTKLACESDPQYFSKTTEKGNALFALGSYFHISVNSNVDNRIAGIRWFVDGGLVSSMNAAASTYDSSNVSKKLASSPHIYFYTKGGKLIFPQDIRDDASGLDRSMIGGLLQKKSGSYNGIGYTQFDDTIRFDNKDIVSIGLLRKMSLRGEAFVEAKPGTIRYSNGKIQGYTKKGWVDFY